MSLQTLIVCSDSKVLQMVVPIFDACRIDTDVCTAVDCGLRRLHAVKYEAILVDCAIAEGATLLQHIHDRSLNRTALVVAMASGPIEAREAGRFGANYIVQKPITQESLHQALRAVYALMVNERRRHYRQVVHFPVFLTTEELPELVAMAVDISQGGISINSILPVAQRGRVRVRFRLSPTDRYLAAETQIRWTRKDRIGLEFTRMSARDREELITWLGGCCETSSPAPAMPVLVPTAV